MGSKVVILGGGPSLRKYIKADCPIWAVGSIYPFKADKYFCLHDFDKLPDNEKVIYQADYPLNEIVGEYGSKFFTNTISYMIAYAIYNEYTEIELFGVDLDSMSEYEHQKASVDYWIGFARGKGIEVITNSNVDDCDFLYGYEPTKRLVEAMQERLDLSLSHLDKCDDEKAQNQWIGQIADLKYWIRRLKQ